jgi:hypothetical protein
MPHPSPAPALAPLARGQTLTRAFAAGDELFCASGTLQLEMSALAGIDAMPGLQLRLQAGQSWRAPAPLRLQITALDGQARLRCSPAAAVVPAPAPASDWRARAAGWLGSRRALRT